MLGLTEKALLFQNSHYAIGNLSGFLNPSDKKIVKCETVL